MPLRYSFVSISGLLFLFIVLGMRVSAQDAVMSEIRFQNENDVYLFNGQDRYYTNGIQLQYRRALDLRQSQNTKLHRKIWSIGMGQKLYNASGGNVFFRGEVDRPITGYLYLQGKMQWAYKNRSEDVLSVGIETALIGKSAFGREVQEAFHSLFNLYDISGWQYQLHSAWGLDMRMAHSRRLYRSKNNHFDIAGNSALSLGLHNIYARLGPQFRLGEFSPLYSSVVSGNRVGGQAGTLKKEFFAFYRPSVTWVGYDATIEGGMLLADKGPVIHAAKPWVFSHQIGVHYIRKRTGLTFYYVFNSKEAVRMERRHQYGAVQISLFY